MKNINFDKLITTLHTALNEDFRGFLKNDCELIVVPDDTFHPYIAVDELKKLGWKHIPGTGQNPIIEFMEKGAIYITRISVPDQKGKYQRTVGILTDAYSEIVIYNGKQQPKYEVMKKIAIEMGYDVDEYTLEEKDKHSVKIVTHKSNGRLKSAGNIVPIHKLPKDCQPVIIDGELMGIISKGKYYNITHFTNNFTPIIENTFKPPDNIK